MPQRSMFVQQMIAQMNRQALQINTSFPFIGRVHHACTHIDSSSCRRYNSSWISSRETRPRVISVVVHSEGKDALGQLQWQERPLGIRLGVLLRWAGMAGLFLLLWRSPVPQGVDPRGLKVLAIFAATIVGIVLQPLPVGAVAILGLTAGLSTQALTFPEAFAAFSSQVPWLIAFAMFLSQAISKSGLGQRLAYAFINAIGRSPLGLVYSLVFSEFLLAPLIPSVAARSGGIILPLVKSVSEACGSRGKDESSRKLGAYLYTCLFHTSAVSSAMFLTANHPNPLSAKLAEVEIGMEVTWGLWARAAIIPGLCSLIVLPLVIWVVYPPTMTDTSSAQAQARDKLKAMGSISHSEWTTLLTLSVTVGLWIGGSSVGINAVSAALVGVSILLMTHIISWDECLSNKSAWNTMLWFSILIGMATQLRKLGVVGLFSNWVANGVSALGWSWQLSYSILVLVYFYSHYFFASNIAHVSAMYAAFLSVAIAAGTPPTIAALCLAFFSNMMGSLTQYGMSHGPMFYAEGYVPLKTWLYIGILISVSNILVWTTVGVVWWKFLGI